MSSIGRTSLAIALFASCVRYDAGIEVPLMLHPRPMSAAQLVGEHLVRIDVATLTIDDVSLEPCDESSLLGWLATGSRARAHDAPLPGTPIDARHLSGLRVPMRPLMPEPGSYCGLRVRLGDSSRAAWEIAGSMDAVPFELRAEQPTEVHVTLGSVLHASLDQQAAIELSFDAALAAAFGSIDAAFSAVVLD